MSNGYDDYRQSGKKSNPIPNVDYPKIDWSRFQVPDVDFKHKLKHTGSSLLLSTGLEHHEYDQLKGWGEWERKKCLKCASPWKLHYMIVPTDQMQSVIEYRGGKIWLAWVYSRVVRLHWK